MSSSPRSVPSAYLGVILIWTTTPLAIKWSSEGAPFLFGLLGRMVIGSILCAWLLILQRKKFPLHTKALQTYFAAGTGIWGSMTLVYWGAQFIPSGWISVIFGLNPILTGVFASFLLGEKGISPSKLLGSVLGVFGLIMIFGGGISLGPQSVTGLAAIFVATTLYCVSAVWVKRIGADIAALATTTGAVVVASALIALTWALWGGIAWPQLIPFRAAMAIVYLGVFGSVMGFILYYHVLRHVEATRVALITLVTPVSALMLGCFLNHEPVTPTVLWGTGSILLGLVCFEFGGTAAILRRLFRGRCTRQLRP